MTDIKDLELRIRSAESTLEMLRGELEELRQQQQQEQPEQESLFGRWATHPKHGRGIITDVEPDSEGEIEFAFPDDTDRDTRTSSVMVEVDELDLDPATLTTAKDFEDAPDGTIVEELGNERGVYVKAGVRWYIAAGSYAVRSGHMPTCRVIRWGNGK
ncbi:hypothetical protein [Corynebacterium amycolatum]|uniref:hypothetical protein n=1 Tax=Corynebacterium amycolatum TaxID=43765 RepID=UPI00234C9E48|nr:hypothetical protein [Corynebacterium amycolatum]MDC7116142.1 hypothetical protein [Corynebacterium amycolatum]